MPLRLMKTTRLDAGVPWIPARAARAAAIVIVRAKWPLAAEQPRGGQHAAGRALGHGSAAPGAAAAWSWPGGACGSRRPSRCPGRRGRTRRSGRPRAARPRSPGATASAIVRWRRIGLGGADPQPERLAGAVVEGAVAHPAARPRRGRPSRPSTARSPRTSPRPRRGSGRARAARRRAATSRGGVLRRRAPSPRRRTAPQHRVALGRAHQLPLHRRPGVEHQCAPRGPGSARRRRPAPTIIGPRLAAGARARVGVGRVDPRRRRRPP